MLDDAYVFTILRVSIIMFLHPVNKLEIFKYGITFPETQARRILRAAICLPQNSK